MKRDLSTRQLAAMLHTTVEEVRSARADKETEKDLAAKAAEAPNVEGDDFDAWYCKKRHDGRYYLIEHHGKKICTHRGTCLSQFKNSSGGNMCNYNRR